MHDSLAKCFPILISHDHCTSERCSCSNQARIPGGGGQGGLAPPFSGEKSKGAKNHTHRKTNDQNRTTTKQDTGLNVPKNTLIRSNFLKKNIVGGGG